MQTFQWTIPGATCRRGGHQPITLSVAATVSDGPEPVLVQLRLTALGPGRTCGERWSPTWAERAVAHLDWVGRPLAQILQNQPPVDIHSCACTEISLVPKLWPLLQSCLQEQIQGKPSPGD